MVAEKLFKMTSQLFILVIITRHFSAEDVGSLMYCFALASIFIFLNQLGLDSLLQKKFTETTSDGLSILTESFVLRLISAVLCIVLINGIGYFLIEEQYLPVLFVTSLYHLYLPFTSFEWFFQAQGRADLAAIALISGHIFSFIYRVYVVFFHNDLLLLSIGYLIEFMIPAFMYVFLVKNNRLSSQLKLSRKEMYVLLKESFPLMISSAVIIMYMKVDQILLGAISSEAEVAFYVAGTRLSEAWYFLGLTILAVYYPKAAGLKEKYGFNAFLIAYAKIVRLVILGSILLIAITFALSDVIVEFLYGHSYGKSALVLNTTILCVPFVYLGTAITMVSLELNNHIGNLHRAALGLLASVVLNLLLIKPFGALGAAFASLGAQVVTGFLGIFVFRNSRNDLVIFLKILFFRS